MFVVTQQFKNKTGQINVTSMLLDYSFTRHRYWLNENIREKNQRNISIKYISKVHKIDLSSTKSPLPKLILQLLRSVFKIIVGESCSWGATFTWNRISKILQTAVKCLPILQITCGLLAQGQGDNLIAKDPQSSFVWTVLPLPHFPFSTGIKSNIKTICNFIVKM